MTVELQDLTISALAQQETEEVASLLHGVIGVRLSSYLNVFVTQQNLGYITGPDTDYAIPEIGTKRPDVGFLALTKVSELFDDIVPFAPDLAAEVISRTDDWSAIATKANQYLEAGTRLVWVIDPYTQSVFVFRKGVKLQTLGVDDELAGLDVVPGFRLKVGLLFPAVPKP